MCRSPRALPGIRDYTVGSGDYYTQRVSSWEYGACEGVGVCGLYVNVYVCEGGGGGGLNDFFHQG